MLTKNPCDKDHESNGLPIHSINYYYCKQHCITLIINY